MRRGAERGGSAWDASNAVAQGFHGGGHRRFAWGLGGWPVGRTGRSDSPILRLHEPLPSVSRSTTEWSRWAATDGAARGGQPHDAGLIGMSTRRSRRRSSRVASLVVAVTGTLLSGPAAGTMADADGPSADPVGLLSSVHRRPLRRRSGRHERRTRRRPRRRRRRQGLRAAGPDASRSVVPTPDPQATPGVTPPGTAPGVTTPVAPATTSRRKLFPATFSPQDPLRSRAGWPVRRRRPVGSGGTSAR